MRVFRKRIVLYSYTTLAIFLFEIIFPAAAHALTGGPSTPEVQSFEPIGTSDMVDMFTGDFHYNLPLMEVDGYPVNMTYNAGINMDQEASWVGLGWNLNPGVINRNMRGIPDDFNGDQIKEEFNIKPNMTIGTKMGASIEIFGKKWKEALSAADKSAHKDKKSLSPSAHVGVYYNNYTGAGIDAGISISAGGAIMKKAAPAWGAGLNLNFNSDGGITVQPNANFSLQKKRKSDAINGVGGGLNANTSYNSRTGMKSLNFGYSLTASGDAVNRKGEKSKERNRSAGRRLGGSGSAIIWGTPTYTPHIEFPMKTLSISGDFAYEMPINAFDGELFANAYYTRQVLKTKNLTRAAFGYQFLENAGEDELTDINREHDGAFSELHKNLPIPITTYDIFSVSGHGIGGTFRLFRNDVPNFQEENMESNSNDISAGFEAGVLKIVKFGLNASYTNTKTRTGSWEGGNELGNRVRTVGKIENPTHPEYEPSYFMQMGEMVNSTWNANATLQGTSLISPQISVNQVGGGFLKYANKNNPTAGKSYHTAGDAISNSNTNRQPRNTIMYALNAYESYYGGLNPYLKWFDVNQSSENGELRPANSAPRSGNHRKPHHLSELNVLSTDGTRYVYDLPAYNTKQVEITFAAAGSPNCKTGLVNYTSVDLDVNQNDNGKNHLVQKTETPPYAYAFHLTGILSPDYVDLRGDGITDDDLGSAVKFNYSKIGVNFKWRTPVAQDSANFIEGNKSDPSDDMGSFIYGEKEIFQVHSIEGKNHIAVFYISERADATGVQNIDGGNYSGTGSFEGEAAMRLDSIILYNKQDFLINSINAYKIKGVHFEYDYSLCESIPNSLPTFLYGDTYAGKLSLKQVYFTYGNSNKGKFSPYSFTYNNAPGDNPIAYDMKSQDRWGVYQPSSTSTCGGTSPNASEFPYTTQNKTNADLYAGAWCLSEITLPSGGKISVEYEADDYGYVQDRRAMTMFKIAGFAQSDNEADMSDLLFTISENKINDRVFFHLGQATTDAEFRVLIDGIKTAQFTVLADINGKGKYNYVRGYFDLVDDPNAHGVCSTNNQLGYCRMKWVPIKDNGNGRSVSPISKNIWNWARLNTPDLVYNRNVEANAGSVGTEIVRAMYAIVGFYNEIINMTKGLYANLRSRGFGQKVSLDASWIRLNARNHIKYGGGHRVKSIRVNDNWAVMGSMNLGAEDAEYGQEYEYTILEKFADGTNATISSGVAQYEPNIGNEENPFHMPEYRIPELKLAPDIAYMNDVPYGESFMPPASVGYRQVTVKNLSHAGVKKTATGKSVYQFYTAKEFPSKISYSPAEVKMVKPNFLEQVFNLNRRSETTASAGQGYLIELNDMHGKPKAEYVYSETSQEPIGGVIYEYHTNPNNSQELLNIVKVVDETGTITEKELATEIEVYNDFRESLTEVTNIGVQANTDFFNIGFLPFVIPSIFGSYSKDFNKVQSAVTVKIVNRYGIQKSTIAIKEGSKIKSENLIYDELSGNLLVSSVQNEFNDDVFSISTPAHWAFDQGMGPAYKNIGIEISGVKFGQDTIILPNGLNPRDYFVPGDYVLVTKSTVAPLICQVYEGKNLKLNLIKAQSGEPFIPASSSYEYTVKVMRSGRKNMHNLPLQQITTLHNPALTSLMDIDSVLSASAVDYKQEWPFYCDSYYKIDCDTTYGIPVEDIQDYFNDLFQLTDFKSGRTALDTACLRSFIEYQDIEWRDTIYTKYKVGGVQTLSVVSIDSCVSCIDSIFVETSENNFYGYSMSSFSSCLNQSGCENINYADAISNHAIYQKMRYILDSLSPCNGEDDTTFSITVKSNYNSLPGVQDISINIAKCGIGNCPGYIDIIDDQVCYTRITEIVDISIRNTEYFDARIRVQLPNGSYDTLDAEGTLHCIPQMWVDCIGSCETPTTSTILNPFRMGMLGNWRAFKNFTYLEAREYNTSPNPRKDGIFSSFTPYWYYNSGSGEMSRSSSTKWIWANEITKYTPFGNEIENKDALGRYSAAVFGFNYTLPIAVGGNTKFEQLAYEGFEENSLFWQKANCFEGHFTFALSDTNQGLIGTDFTHSGNYSLKVKTGEEISSTSYELGTCGTYVDPLDSNAMLWQNCNCVGKFSPKEGKYILSTWMKQGDNPLDTSYNNAKVQVILHASGGNTTLNYYASGPIVEGWQRVFVEVDVPSGTDAVEIKLVSSLTVDTWFDDFRMHPFNSNMKSYAYDQITLRLLAELDENNFATFYEYDQEGALIRVKKETERGVMTLKEVRKQIVK